MFFGLPTETDEVLSVTIYILCAILVVCTLFSICFKERQVYFQKLVGGVVVFIVALLSHNSWVVWSSLFIGGLIIASEEFMKSLAAILRSSGDRIPDVLSELNKNTSILEDLKGEGSINEDSNPSPTSEEVQKAEEAVVIQLMEPTTGNFLTLAFEIERLLKIAASTILEGEALKKKDMVSPIELREKGLLTEAGVKKVESIRWLRNMLVHGRAEEIDKESLDLGVQVAGDLYREISDWLNPNNG